MEEQDIVEGTSTEIRDPQAVLTALEKAKAEAKRFRLEKEALETQINDSISKISKFQEKVMMDNVHKNLSSLGIANADKLVKYLKMDQLQLNEDLEIDGLAEQIETLKTDFPELFDPKFIVAGKADSGRSTEVETPKSVTDLQVKYILNK